MKLPPNFDTLSWELGQIQANASLIRTGVRPVACVMICNECLDYYLKAIENENIQYILDPRGETHTSIYMYKHPCIENIINFMLNKPYDRKALMHWINGKMFGYSDEEIAKYIVTTSPT